MKAVADMNLGKLAAYVCSHLEAKGVQVVLSGGGCVAIYASDRYSSMGRLWSGNKPQPAVWTMSLCCTTRAEMKMEGCPLEHVTMDMEAVIR